MSFYLKKEKKKIFSLEPLQQARWLLRRTALSGTLPFSCSTHVTRVTERKVNSTLNGLAFEKLANLKRKRTGN